MLYIYIGVNMCTLICIYIYTYIYMCAMYLCMYIHDKTCESQRKFLYAATSRNKSAWTETDGCGIFQAPGHQLKPCQFGGASIGLYWQEKMILKIWVCWLGNTCLNVLYLCSTVLWCHGMQEMAHSATSSTFAGDAGECLLARSRPKFIVDLYSREFHVWVRC